MTIASTNVRHTGAMSADLQTASITVYTDSGNAGDRLMAILYCADVSVTSGVADASAFTLPPGWTITSLTSLVPTGDPRRLSGAVLVAEKTLTSTTTDQSVFTWSCVQWRPMKLYKTWCQLTNGSTITTHMQHTASITTFRFTSIRGTKTQVLTSLQNQKVTYPGANTDYAVSGHVVRIGAVKQAKSAGTLLASGMTQKALFGPLKYGGFDGVPQTGVTSMMVSTADVSAVTSVADAAGTAVGDGFALTLLVTTVVKPQVAFITPASGSAADLTKPLPVTWTGPIEGAQTDVAIYRETPPGSGLNIQWWTGAGWGGGGVWVRMPGQSATLPGWAATPGQATRYLIQSRTDAAADWSDFSVVDVTSRATPAAPTITLSPAPSGGVIASRVPTMTVAGTVTDGGSVLGWQLEWRDASTGELLASGTSTPWALNATLPNFTAVKARARFLQGGGMWSPWAESTVTISVPQPAAPPVTVGTAVHPVSGLPLPQLTVTAAAGLTVRVERDGAVLGEVVSSGATVQVVDLACPSGPVSWTVTTLASTPFAERSLPTLANGNVADTEWLFDPTRPETAVHVALKQLDSVAIDLHSQVFDPIGNIYSVVQPGIPSAPTSGMTFQAFSLDTADRTVELLSTGAVLVYRGWSEQDDTTEQSPDVVFQAQGTVNISRNVQGPRPFRLIQVSYVTAPPVVAGLAMTGWTPALTGDDPTQADLTVFDRKWYARDSDFRSGAPMYNNAWKRGNIAIGGGNAQLTLANPTGSSPSGAELVSRESFGYGTYRIHASADFANLAPGVVFGLFTFDWTGTAVGPGYNEIDIVEVSSWASDQVTAKATWYTDAGDPVTLGEVVWPAGKTDITVRLDYASQYVRVRIYAGDEATTPILDKTGSGALIPPHRKEAVHVNLWQGQWGGIPASPQSVARTTVTVTGFSVDPIFVPPVVTPTTTVAYRASSSAQLSTAGTGPVTVANPGMPGDLLLMVCAISDSTADVNAPSGLTFLDFNTDSPMRVFAWWTVVAAGDPSSYQWSFSKATKAVAGIVAYQGVNTAAPLAGFDYQSESGTNVTAHKTPILTVDDDSFIVSMGVDLAALSSWSSGTDVKRLEVKNTSSPGLSLVVFDGGAVSAGTVQRTLTASQPSSNASAWVLAITGN